MGLDVQTGQWNGVDRQVASRQIGQFQAVSRGVGGILNQADDCVGLGQFASSLRKVRGLRRQLVRQLSELQA